MKRATGVAGLLLLAGVLGGALVFSQLIKGGLSARDEPSGIEAFMARRLRRLATPRDMRDLANPVAASPEVLAAGRAHFADHCASCHGNDGRGETPMGQNLYPKAPDMTLTATQSLSDGEIFFSIHNGIRLSGMPAWGDGSPADDRESWGLVHFIRHLPEIQPEELEEMEALNPRSRKEFEEEEEMREFLEGGKTEPPSVPHHH